MTILILNWRDIRHPLSGGAEISLHEQAKYWRDQGNKIIWFASSFNGAKNEEVIDGIKVLRKGSHFTVHIWAFLFYHWKKFDRFDIVIDSFHFLPFFTPLYISSSKIIGLINEVAGKVWFANLWYPLALIGYYLEPTFFKVYKKNIFITGSESAKNDLIKIGLSKKNISIVPHGFYPQVVSKRIHKEKKPVIVFLGRVSVDKGIKDALEVTALLQKKIKDISLWIIGKEERTGLLQSLLKELSSQKLEREIHYFGYVSEERKAELLKRAWILLHPSQKEGWGLNVIEAASQGTPTVGYNIEGLRDSVRNGKTGILVTPNDRQALVVAIESLLDGQFRERYNLFAKNAREWSKNFNWGKSSKQSLAIITEIYESNKKKK